MSEYLTAGTVTNAVNMPSVSAEDAKKLKPYIDLAGQMGSFAGQIAESGIKSVKIEYDGAVAGLNTKPLTAVALEGLLKPLVETVNMINAPVIAKERNIDVSEVKRDRISDYQTLLRITVVTDNGAYDISGTLFGSRPRIVEVSGVKLEASMAPRMLYVTNEDKPGLIGNLGKLLGEAKINIANFHLGRNDAHNAAVALLEVDDPVSAELLAKIAKLPSVKQVRILHF
jgi:D-3-phosphoglycerate dehydrogenase